MVAKSTAFLAAAMVILSCASCAKAEQDPGVLANSVAAGVNLAEPLDRARNAEKFLLQMAKALPGPMRRPGAEARVQEGFAQAEPTARKALAAYYMKALTRAELEEAGAFYAGPVGRAWTEKSVRLWQAQGDMDADDVAAIEAVEREFQNQDGDKRRLIEEVLAVHGFAASIAPPLMILDTQLVRPPPRGAGREDEAMRREEEASRATKQKQQNEMLARYARSSTAEQRLFLAREFTDAELRELLGFLKSPGGRAMVRLRDEAESVAVDALAEVATSNTHWLSDPNCVGSRCRPEQLTAASEVDAQLRQSARYMIRLKP